MNKYRKLYQYYFAARTEFMCPQKRSEALSPNIAGTIHFISEKTQGKHTIKCTKKESLNLLNKTPQSNLRLSQNTTAVFF